MKQAEAKMVPKLHTLNIYHYERILETTQNQRERYYEYLFLKEKTKEYNDVIGRKKKV